MEHCVGGLQPDRFSHEHSILLHYTVDLLFNGYCVLYLHGLAQIDGFVLLLALLLADRSDRLVIRIMELFEGVQEHHHVLLDVHNAKIPLSLRIEDKLLLGKLHLRS